MQQNGLRSPEPPREHQCQAGWQPGQWWVLPPLGSPTPGVSQDGGTSTASPHQWGDAPGAAPKAVGPPQHPVTSGSHRAPMNSPVGWQGPQDTMQRPLPCPHHPHSPPHATPWPQPTAGQLHPPAPPSLPKDLWGCCCDPAGRNDSTHTCARPHGDPQPRRGAPIPLRVWEGVPTAGERCCPHSVPCKCHQAPYPVRPQHCVLPALPRPPPTTPPPICTYIRQNPQTRGI